MVASKAEDRPGRAFDDPIVRARLTRLREHREGYTLYYDGSGPTRGGYGTTWR